MTEQLEEQTRIKEKKGFSGLQVLGIVAASICLAIVATLIAIKMFFFPAPFEPVTLSQKEEIALRPEQYSEDSGSREIKFTERELNAMVAKNTDLADKVAIDLAQDMISIKLLIPFDPDFPILGGKTVKVRAGAELAYRDGRPVVRLRGVSLMGVPMPNAWLGGLKNIDLIHEFGNDEGFWKGFADGVESIDVVDGFLNIKLKE